MPRGGARPGAGRPKGTKRKPRAAELGAPYADAHSPIEYLLELMRDPGAAAQRRDRAAVALLPYCHTRPAEELPGKRQRQALAAQAAARGRLAAPAPPLGLPARPLPVLDQQPLPAAGDDGWNGLLYDPEADKVED